MKVASFLKEVQKVAKIYQSESKFRYEFLKLFEGFLKESGAEGTVVEVEESIVTGRADARVGTLVFEFKKPGLMSEQTVIHDALSGLRSHLQQYAARGVDPTKLLGIATDGFAALAMSYDERSKDFEPIDQFETRIEGEKVTFSLGSFGLLFTRVVPALTRRLLSPQNLIADFAPDSTLCKLCVPVLWKLLDASLGLARPIALYEQWERLFSLSTAKVVDPKALAGTLSGHGLGPYELKTKEDVRSFLFVVHTYYALVLKLIALAVADELSLFGEKRLLGAVQTDPRSAFAMAEEVFPKLTINVIEQDIFSWFDDMWNSDMDGVLKQLAVAVSNYDVTAVKRDVLKRMYQFLIPPKLRQSLGEFYTKDWVANLVLDAVEFRGVGRILDPACGSGTFIVLAIERVRKHLRGQPPSKVLPQILDQVVGFDVNPIAVMTSRINYLLAIADLLPYSSTGVSIPVFLCDSVLLPEETYDVAMQAKVTLVDTPVGQFRLPPTGDNRLLLRLLEENLDKRSDAFIEAVRSKFRSIYVQDNLATLRELHKQMSELNRQGKNGVWCKLIRNFFAPLILAQFDYVVGNPPWVAPERVPKAYRDRVNSLIAHAKYLAAYTPNFIKASARFPGAGEQFVSCLPFIARALDHYLRPGGKLAFLLTSSLTRSLNAGGFRERMFEMKLSKIVDLTLYTDVHEGASCWSFIPVVENARAAGNEVIDYLFVVPKTRERLPERRPETVTFKWTLEKASLSLDSKNSHSPWFVASERILSIYRRMQQHPRLGDLYPINMGIKTSKNDVYFVEEIQRTGSSLIACRTLGRETPLVEPALLFPLVRGQDLHAWRFDWKHIILPHDTKDWKPIKEAVMVDRFPEGYKYLLRHRRELVEERSDYKPASGPFYTIFRISPSKMVGWRVAYKEIGTKLQACVVPLHVKDPVLGERPVLVDHKLYSIATTTREEALFLAGVLNSTPLRTFSYCFASPKGGIPFRDFVLWVIGILPIPLWNPKDRLHREISEISEALAEQKPSGEKNDREVDGLLSTLDSKVGELYGLAKEDLEILGRHYDSLTGALTEASTDG